MVAIVVKMSNRRLCSSHRSVATAGQEAVAVLVERARQCCILSRNGLIWRSWSFREVSSLSGLDHLGGYDAMIVREMVDAGLWDA